MFVKVNLLPSAVLNPPLCSRRAGRRAGLSRGMVASLREIEWLTPPPPPPPHRPAHPVGQGT